MTVRPTPEQRAAMAAYVDAKQPGLLDDLGIPRDDRIGKQVQLRAGHPHAGRCGRIVDVKQLDGAEAVHVQMDGYLGECFAFPGQWRELIT